MGKATDHKDSDAGVRVILYKSKTLADSSHPLMLRITKDRKRKYISIGESCLLKFWDEEKGEPRRSHPDRARLKELIRVWESKYSRAAVELKQVDKPFTAMTVATQVAKTVRKVRVFGFIDEVIDRFTREKRLGSATTVNTLKGSLLGFEKAEGRSPESLLFTDISPAYLEDYKVYLSERGLSQISMAVYFRTLRQVYNQAVKRGLVADKYYPFKEFKISQFDLRTRKRAITKADMLAIASLEPSAPRLLLAKHLFLFSYYGAGINFIDLAHLTWKDVQGGRLKYQRQKTGHLFNFKLADNALAILEYYRPLTAASTEAYVFPILELDKHITALQIKNRVHKKLGQMNQDLKVLAEMAGIDTVLTTYVARHSFATSLKRAGVNSAIIREAMGHQTEAITQTYLAEFENDLIDEAFDNL